MLYQINISRAFLWIIKFKIICNIESFSNTDIIKIDRVFIAGVAKLLDSQSHFSKFEIFCEPQINTYLKGLQESIKIT